MINFGIEGAFGWFEWRVLMVVNAEVEGASFVGSVRCSDDPDVPDVGVVLVHVEVEVFRGLALDSLIHLVEVLGILALWRGSAHTSSKKK